MKKAPDAPGSPGPRVSVPWAKKKEVPQDTCRMLHDLHLHPNFILRQWGALLTFQVRQWHEQIFANREHMETEKKQARMWAQPWGPGWGFGPGSGDILPLVDDAATGFMELGEEKMRSPGSRVATPIRTGNMCVGTRSRCVLYVSWWVRGWGEWRERPHTEEIGCPLLSLIV